MSTQARPTDDKSVRVDNVIGQMYETFEYEQFRAIQGNRPISNLHVKRLVLSFNDRYLVSPICVNEKMDIIDGQHRLEAAKELNLPVRYFIMRGYGLKEVHLLNANSSNWKKVDFLIGYCSLGRPEYLKMKDFMGQYPDLSFSVVEAMLSGNIGGANNKKQILLGGKKSRERTFEQGDFVVVDIDAAHEMAKAIMAFKSYTPFYTSPTFAKAIMVFLKNPNYSNSQMVERIKNNPHLLANGSASAPTTIWQVILEDAYNRRSREKVSLKYK